MVYFQKLASLKSYLRDIGLTSSSLAVDSLLKQAAPKPQELINRLSEKHGRNNIGGAIAGYIETLRNKPKYLEWITIRFLDNPQYEELHGLNDSFSIITSFAAKEASIAEKFKSNEEFRTNLAELIPGKTFSIATFSNTMDKTFLSLSGDNFNDILVLVNRNKGAIDYGPPIPDEKDRVGKVGHWNLWMPSSKANSCKIAGYNRLTLKPNTEWCTARTSGENLFYNYTGIGGGQSVNLFYVIADNPTTNDDWLSVGFVGGEPILEGQSGSISVTRNQRGLTPELLKDILDSDYDQIMMILSNHDAEIGDDNPAKMEVLNAAKSVQKLIEVTKNLSAEAKTDIVKNIVDNNPSEEVIDHLYSNIPDDKLRGSIVDAYLLDRLLEQHGSRNEISIERAIKLIEDPSEIYEWFLDQSSKTADLVYSVNNQNKQKILDIFEKRHGSIENRAMINVDKFIKENTENLDDLDVNIALNRAVSSERESSTYSSIVRSLREALETFGKVDIENGTGITLEVDIKKIINDLAEQFESQQLCKKMVVSRVYDSFYDEDGFVRQLLSELRDDELINAETISFHNASDPHFDSENFNEILSGELDELL